MKEIKLRKVGITFMKKQAFNPYLPSWEYIPDGEPYVFNGRVYVYGSHDFTMDMYFVWVIMYAGLLQ